MSSDRRRPRVEDDDDDRPSSRNKHRRLTRSPSSPPRRRTASLSFPSYLDDPNLPPKIRLLCEIVARTPPDSLLSALDSSGVLSLSHDDVELVLKLSYSHPSSALRFFRWSTPLLRASPSQGPEGKQGHPHSPYSWNLVVDLLGKNALFDAMWDAARSMRPLGLLSLATFASIFSSYASHSLLDAAVRAFHLMGSPDFPLPRDPPALNSLLSALCRHGHSQQARCLLLCGALHVPPDADSFAILLEGADDDRDPRGALEAFSSMVSLLGWDPSHSPAHDSFLSAIARGGPDGGGGLREALKHLDILLSHGCPPGTKFYRTALDEAVRLRDPDAGAVIWHSLTSATGSITRPDVRMYNSMIALLCYSNQVDAAFEMLDEMVTRAVFPDGDTYNVMLQFMVKGRKLRDAAVVFKEMRRNEVVPTMENCKMAFKAFMDHGDGEMMVRVWRCMVENGMGGLEECGNSLIMRLRELDMVPEACKHAEEMVEKGIKVNSSTLSRLRNNLVKVGRGSVYEQIMSKWKLH